MLSTFTASVRDGLSNLAASLGAGKDKASADAFVFRDLSRAQIEAMYRGDWLARKVVDIVPADMCREWRAWSGHRADVERMEAAERRLGLRRAVQRALVLGRLYGGAAIVIGTGEADPAALARPLDPNRVRYGGLQFLHVVNRWELSAPGLDRDPLSPWYGEASAYEVVAPGRGSLVLHPSRVVRFLGNEAPDPSLAGTVWSDSVLLALYDAIHAVALTMAGATSLMHEAKVDIVTVPNLSEHLSSSETTAQLSARFGYAAAMKSINNLLLLGDGETWNRQKVDFAGLPEMVRTFLQVAAGAADIPVTRLLGQSPAGLSATGESDTRNYYDMVSARQEVDLRPKLERLDRLLARSEGLDPGALAFAFRPLWQLDAATAATVALQKAQATQVYAGLGLWPTAVTARLVEAQLAEDGTYPNAAAVFGEASAVPNATATLDFDPDQPRDPDGRWTAEGVAPASAELSTTAANASAPTDLLHGTSPDQLEALNTILGPLGTGSESTATEREHVVAAQFAPAVPIVRALMAAAAFYTYRAVQAAVQEIAKHLPSWSRSAPPQPGPQGSGPPPSEPPEEPRPLTIHGPKGSSGPPGLSPAGATPSSSPGRSPSPPLPPLPPYVPAEPFSLKPAARPEARPSDPNQLPDYSFSQQGGDPPDAGAVRKPVWVINIPSGLTIPVKSGKPTEEGKAYQGEVRENLLFDSAPNDNTKGGNMPDGVMAVPASDAKIALEVKYLSRNERPLRDPDRDVRFIFEQDVAQAGKYLNGYKGGLLWVTNDTRLAAKYADEFEKAGLSGIRIVVIPSIQE